MSVETSLNWCESSTTSCWQILKEQDGMFNHPSSSFVREASKELSKFSLRKPPSPPITIIIIISLSLYLSLSSVSFHKMGQFLIFQAHHQVQTLILGTSHVLDLY